MPRGDKTHIMKYQVPVFTDSKKLEFNRIATKIQDLQTSNRAEIITLKKLSELLIQRATQGA